jgi:predicted signal transduction protein with EAL and GGDEF domain
VTVVLGTLLVGGRSVGGWLLTLGLALLLWLAVAIPSALWFRSRPSPDPERAQKQRELREAFLPHVPRMGFLAIGLIVIGWLLR